MGSWLARLLTSRDRKRRRTLTLLTLLPTVPTLGVILLIFVALVTVMVLLAGQATQRCGLSTLTPTTGSMSAGQMVVWLEGQGISPNGAAGIVGNAQQENGLSPALNSGGLGLFQWTGARAAAVGAYAAAHGVPAQSVEAQLGFLIQDLQGPYVSLLARLQAAPSPQQAADDFEAAYERAGVPALTNREQYAVAALQAAGGASGTVPVSYNPQGSSGCENASYGGRLKVGVMNLGSYAYLGAARIFHDAGINYTREDVGNGGSVPASCGGGNVCAALQAGIAPLVLFEDYAGSNMPSEIVNLARNLDSLAKQYPIMSQMRAIEFGNEMWQGTSGPAEDASTYGAQYDAAHRALAAAGLGGWKLLAAATAICGDQYSSPAWINEVIAAQSSGASEIDGWTVHPYGPMNTDLTPDCPGPHGYGWPDAKDWHDIAVKAGSNAPWYVTEVGQCVGGFGCNRAVSLDEQAADMTQYLNDAAREPWIAAFFWYQTYDDGTGWYGLLGNDQGHFGEPVNFQRPAFAAMKQWLASQLSAPAGGVGAQAMLAAAQAASAAGIPYSGSVQASGLLAGFRSDCSGFVTWVLSRGGVPGVADQTTVTLPPLLAAGPGVTVTVWNRPLPGQQGHVIIDIGGSGGSWYESGGRSGGGPHQMSTADVVAELGTSQLGSGITPNGFLPLHPLGM